MELCIPSARLRAAVRPRPRLAGRGRRRHSSGWPPRRRRTPRAAPRPTRSRPRTARPARPTGTSRAAAPATRASRATRLTSASTQGAPISVQGRQPGRRLHVSTSTAWASTAGRRARGHEQRRPLPARRIRRRARTRRHRLIGCGDWAVRRAGPFPPLAVSGIYFAHARRATTAAGSATSSSSSATTTAPRTSVPDVRHDLAGLQRLRRRTLYATRRPAGRRPPRLCRLLRPALHHAGERPGGLGVQRRVPDGPLPRGQRLRRELQHRRGLGPLRRRAARARARSSPSGTTSTGPAPSAPTSSPHATRGVNLAFFSGNEVFWKTRWETHRPAQPDRPTRRPTPTRTSTRSGTWTGTWRDPRSINARGRAAGERADGHDLHRQLGHRATCRSRRRTAAAALARDAREPASSRAASRRSGATSSATSGTRTSTTVRGPPA